VDEIVLGVEVKTKTKEGVDWTIKNTTY